MLENCHHPIKKTAPTVFTQFLFFHKNVTPKIYTKCQTSSILLLSDIPLPMQESHSFCSTLPLKHQFPVNIILSIHLNYLGRGRERGLGPRTQTGKGRNPTC